jgi:menaquinone-dependent protoporphyrinogen oxidase
MLESTMARSILVAYATHCGSTQEVAEAIADVLREPGVAVDVWPVEDVRSVEGYSAVVVGSAVHRGHLLPHAIAFVRGFSSRLREVPVALFCMRISSPTPRSRHAYRVAVREYIQPVSEVSFTGRFDKRGAALLMPRLLACVVPAIDRRDWGAICRWAHDLRVVLGCSAKHGAAQQGVEADKAGQGWSFAA